MGKFGENEESVSPMLGAFILVGLVVVMFVAVGVLVSVFKFNLPESAPMVSIVVTGAKGGLINDTPAVNFNENWITLYHKAGDPLDISRTKIQIRGYGETQDNTFGREDTPVNGSILVEYTNLAYDGKLEARPQRDNEPYSPEYHGYEYHNPDLSDGFWSAGESLILNGQDSKSSGASSTVEVYLARVDKTDNNWRFGKGKPITITVIDASTNRTVATARITVKSV